MVSGCVHFRAGCSCRLHWNVCCGTSKQTLLHAKHQSLVCFMRIVGAGLCFSAQSLNTSGLCSQQAGQGIFFLTCPWPGEPGKTSAQLGFTGKLLFTGVVVVLQDSSKS